MSNLEGDFAVEDFLDESSDFAQGVNIVNERFSDEGEPAMLLIEGDVLDPRVYAAIDELRERMNTPEDGIPEKITKTPDGNIDLLALDELVFATQGSMVLDDEPFRARGWNPDVEGNGVGCNTTQLDSSTQMTEIVLLLCLDSFRLKVYLESVQFLRYHPASSVSTSCQRLNSIHRRLGSTSMDNQQNTNTC